VVPIYIFFDFLIQLSLFLCLTVKLSTATTLLPVSFTKSMYIILFRGLTLTAAHPGGRAVCGRSLAGIVGLIPAGGMDVCCERCVLSGRDLCDELNTRPEESYRVWCVRV